MAESTKKSPGSGSYFNKWPDDLLLHLFHLTDFDDLKELRLVNSFYANFLAPRIMRQVSIQHLDDIMGELQALAGRPSAFHTRSLRVQVTPDDMPSLSLTDFSRDWSRWCEVMRLLRSLDHLSIMLIDLDANAEGDELDHIDNVIDQLNITMVAASNIKTLLLAVEPADEAPFRTKAIVAGNWPNLQELRIHHVHNTETELIEFFAPLSASLRILEMRYMRRGPDNVDYRRVFVKLASEFTLTHFCFGSETERFGGVPEERAMTRFREAFGRISE